MSEIEAAKTPREVEATSLNVSDLSFTPSTNYIERPLEYIRYHLSLVNLDFFLPFYYGPTKVYRNVDGVPLRNVTFTAFSGELVGVLGAELERRELVHLLTGRKKTGSYDGSISLRGNGIAADSYYYNSVTFVQKKTMYVPGLSYLDMIYQSAEMRLAGTGVDVAQRVDDVLTIMSLQHIKDRVIGQFPATTGEAGSDLRRLNIAIQIVTLPALIVVEEPSPDNDPFYSVKILSCLKRLTKRGHIVVCSTDKPTQNAFDMYDRVVLLSEGYSIYAASPIQLDEHFCSNDLGFQHKNDITTVDFATGVRTGEEHSGTGQVGPHVLHEKFEGSKLYVAPSNDSANVQAFTPDFFIFFGLKGDLPSPVVTAQRFWTSLKRAYVAKLKDHLQLFSLFLFSVVISTLIGYLQYGQGSYGNYCISIIGLPFKNTTNIGFVFFIMALFPQVHFFLEAHTITQKMRVFRNEQDAKVTSAASFFVVTLLSEAPSALIYGLASGSIIYGMTDLDARKTDYGFWICVVLLASCVGISTCIMYCALFRKQRAIRNMFFVSVVIMIMLSGYPFTQHHMPYYLTDFSEIIPTRWVYEGLFKWYFSQKLDGALYLNIEAFTSFRRSDLFLILRNFLLVMNGITLVALFPQPVLLSRGTAHSEANSTKNPSASAPAVAYTEVESEKAAARREGEVVAVATEASPSSGRVKKIVSAPRKKVPTTDEESHASGTFVILTDVSYQVPGETVLQRVSGQFEAGRLNLILGGKESGKTSLLNVIAGNTADNTKVTGQITFDGQAAAANDTPLFQRVGFVAQDVHQYRDLTVKQVVTFAMKLRQPKSSDVEHSVDVAIAALHLQDVADVRVKQLTKGEYKRLAIAEESVHNPKLLLLDQPTSDVGEEEGSLIVNTLREMVNNDRTVVASLAHPTIEAFNLFDTVLVLSKGRVIYSGRVDAAVQFFKSSPFHFSNADYNNPADFLIDIANGHVTNEQGQVVETDQLENHYLQSAQYRTANPDAANKAGTGTLEIGNDTTPGAHLEEHKPQPEIILAIKAGWAFATKVPSVTDFTDSLRIRAILFHRASVALLARYELLIATSMTHIILGILYGWVNKHVNPSSVIAYLGVGTLFLLVAASQLVYYIHNNYNVFLKEHGRGLYSSYTNYTVHTQPLYIMACINGILFAVPSWGMMDVNTDTDMYGVILVLFIFVVICATMIVEVQVNLTNNVPVTHFAVIALAAVQFMIGGLFLKAGSFRRWLEPWITSLSVIRWVMQAGFVKMYDGNRTIFPSRFPNAPNYTLYNGYLNLFGWGGKTARYCIGMLIINALCWRAITFVTFILGAYQNKGTRKVSKA